MKKIQINPLRLLAIGMVVILVGAIAKITKESFYQPILITGLIIELISIVLLVGKFNFLIKKNNKQ